MPSDSDPTFLPGEQIGDYLLDDRIYKGTNTSTWDATQVSIQRDVLLHILDDGCLEDEQVREAFIADVRRKAAVEHPLIASVLEAVNEGPLCFYAVEKLSGQTLGELYEKDSSISPVHAARIIRNISGACAYLEAKHISTLPLSPDDIHVDDKYHCRIANLAVSGDLKHLNATRDKEMVGHLVQDMVRPNEPGSTRTNSLLGFMADLKRKEPLSWEKIHDLSAEIERQLARPSEHGQIKSPTMRMDPARVQRIKFTSGLGKLLAVIVILLIIVGLVYHFTGGMVFQSGKRNAPAQRQLKDMILIPAGKYPGPDDLYVKMPAIWIDAHEVTIGEYAEFLTAFDELAPEKKAACEHSDQPAEKKSHEPDDWQNLYHAAKTGGTWNLLEVDLHYPVVGVDWWDAHAYATWKDRRLPSHEEWFTACSSGSDPGKLPAAGWNPVDQTEKTTLGLHGMAGNVSEWTREKTLNPADPSAPPRYVITGASYLQPKLGALAREWVESRSLRRPDLGFRTYSIPRQDD